jgi:hypothetical protein
MTSEQYLKIKKTKKTYQYYIDSWIVLLEDAKHRLQMEIWAMDAFGSMPDPKDIENIELDANLAKECISNWTQARDRKIKSVLEGKEFEHDIEQVFS